MPKTFKAKELAKFYRQLRIFRGQAVAVEHTKGGTARVLFDIQLDTTPGKRPTTRRIRVIEDGREKYYDGNYEFQVTALLLGNDRFAVGEKEGAS